MFKVFCQRVTRSSKKLFGKNILVVTCPGFRFLSLGSLLFKIVNFVLSGNRAIFIPCYPSRPYSVKWEIFRWISSKYELYLLQSIFGFIDFYDFQFILNTTICYLDIYVDICSWGKPEIAISGINGRCKMCQKQCEQCGTPDLFADRNGETFRG